MATRSDMPVSVGDEMKKLLLLGDCGRACGAAGFVAVLLAALMGSSPAAAAPNAGPSFDCAKATSIDERTICANPYLSRIDVLVSRAYARFTPAYGNKRVIGKGLLQDRHACGSDEACIAAVEANALETYGAYVSWPQSYAEALIGAKAMDVAAAVPSSRNQPIPQRVGDCAVTHIAQLITRLGKPLAGADPSEGAAVGYANRGWGVSYDMVDGLYNAQVGDPVVMCLMSIPRDCPRGDKRGRVYYGLDMRTGGTWSLPDSQHSCGGA